MDRMPQPGDIYRNLNGELFRIITLAEHADRKEALVVYQALDKDMRVYALPLEAFSDGEDAGKEKRFILLPAVGTAPVATSEAAGYSRISETGVLPVRNETAHEVQTRPTQGGSAPEAKEQPAQSGNGPEAKEQSERSQQEAEVQMPEEFVLDPGLLAFLEADSYEKKLEIYASLAGRADESMLNTIAISLDLELSGDTLEDQYANLKNCLLMLEKYECNRLR